VQSRRSWVPRAVSLLVVLASGSASADTGIMVGPRGGVAFGDDVDPYGGVDVRLSVPDSPITINPTIDYISDEDQTLYQVGANVLYHLPVASRVAPYVGIGLDVTSFRFREGVPTDDNEGYRVGMHFLGGARLDLPYVSPFVQVAKGIGEYDLLTVGGGLAFRLRDKRGTAPPPVPARFAITPYIANDVAGDVQSGHGGGLGLSLVYRVLDHLGFELDGELHGHFFRDEDVADLVPEGVDLDTKAALLTGSVVVPYCLRSPSFGTWCPYATAGAGIIHAQFDGFPITPGAEPFAASQTNFAFSAGAGLTHVFTRRVALRVDARYFRALVDEGARDGGYFKDYGFLRVSAGVSIGLW
jgi:opacity protein-like surface antigen